MNIDTYISFGYYGFRKQELGQTSKSLAIISVKLCQLIALSVSLKSSGKRSSSLHDIGIVRELLSTEERTNKNGADPDKIPASI